MESFLKLLEARVSFNAILQIGIDVIILGLLAGIMLAKRPRMSKKDEAVLASLEKIVEDTAEISKKFETNLEKRQDLLKQITAQLDERIEEGRKLCVRLEELSRIEPERVVLRPPPAPAPGLHVSDRQKVLALAAKGFKAAEIAQRLKRPVGEVELILNLRKIAS
jgi:DNA-binding NarL/FixJ family response regulator